MGHHHSGEDTLMPFKDEQIKLLSGRLDEKFGRTRQQAGKSLSFIEGWHVIAAANRIFGFYGWDPARRYRRMSEAESVKRSGRSCRWPRWSMASPSKAAAVAPEEPSTIVAIGMAHGD
jgi:hypothetical protein